MALVSTREPLDQYATLPPAPPPPETVGAPLPRRPCLFSFSLSLSLLSSLLSTGYPSAPWPTCSPTPGKRDDTVETGFRPAEDSGRKYSAQQNFSTHASRGLCRKNVKKKKKRSGRSRESLWKVALFREMPQPDFSEKSRERKSFQIKYNVIFPRKLILIVTPVAASRSDCTLFRSRP